MPVSLKPLLKSKVANFTLEFWDIDDTKKPLMHSHVRIDLLDDKGQASGVLFQGFSNADGKVQFKIPVPKAVAGQQPKPLPKIHIRVLDLDEDNLYNKIIQPEIGKAIAPIVVSQAQQTQKILAPLNDFREIIGRDISPVLKKALNDKKVASLFALRLTDPDPFITLSNLSNQDRIDLSDLKLHAQLQLVSRDHKINQALIKSGYKNIFDITKQSQTAFVTKVKAAVGEETAIKLHKTALCQVQAMGNMLFSTDADAANQIGESDAELPCKCSCNSAVSPQAYLVDLVDYAVDNVLLDSNPISLTQLEKTFNQPLASLPVGCEFASQPVRQVRLCIEVLHHRNKLLNNADIPAVSDALIAHARKAYDILLRSLGSSYQELRAIRSHEASQKSLSQRLGIPATELDNFRLEVGVDQARQLNETNLERLFGLQATARNPLSAVQPAEWLTKRKAFLRTIWQGIDHPVNDLDVPMVDPDIVDESEFMRPYDQNTAHIIWDERTKQLQDRRDKLDGKDSISKMLAEVYGNKFDLAVWKAIQTKLQSVDPEGTEALKDVDENLTQQTFSFLLLLATRDDETQEIKPQEREQALDVLVNIFKLEQYENWRKEEKDENITLSAPFFLLSEKEPILNPLRASSDARTKWRTVLERNSIPPLIDPDIITDSYFSLSANSTIAYSKWEERLGMLGDGRDKNDNDDHPPRIEGSIFSAIATIDTVDKLDKVLTTNNLQPDLDQPVLFHRIGFVADELIKINEAFEKGKALPLKPEQFGLTIGELRTLFAVRRLANNADANDWNQVHHILVQAEKRRYLFPQWRIDEADAGIFLTPDVFSLPSDTFMDVRPKHRLAPGFLQFRRDSRQQRAWHDQLKMRIEQEQAIDAELQTAIDDAEAATLPALRDDLVMASVSEAVGGVSLEERKRWVMNNLLINAFENGCRKTTRVAQAIDTMQLLLWGIHSKQFENDKYTLEAASAETFNEEWAWLGSYATWRSAMFTYLYPENLLLPELRRAIDGHPNPDTDPTKLFQAILKVISGQATPPSAQSENGDESDVTQTDEDEELVQFVQWLFTYLDKADSRTIEGQKIIYALLPSLRLRDAVRIENNAGTPLSPIFGTQPADKEINPYYFLRETIYSELKIPAWHKYINRAAFLEDALYIPLTFALVQLRQGNFNDALYWFGIVYNSRSAPDKDLQGWTNPCLELYFKQRNAPNNLNLQALNIWLNDTLNPHFIAATRNNADLRFVLLSIIRCLLDYADSEFSKDTAESLARARELYETARRLLESQHLGKESADCEAMLTFISEIGEGYFKEILSPELDLSKSPSLGELSKNVLDKLMSELKGILKPTNPPKPRAVLRQEIHKIVKRNLTSKPPRKLETIVLRGQDNFIMKVNKLFKTDSKIFLQVQQTGKVDFILPAIGIWVPPAKDFQFCIPRNPLIDILRLRYEVSWFKLNNCMNFAGQHREVPLYAAPTDTYSGMPISDLGNTDGFSAAARFVPTLYRYRVLIERAKQLVAMAQQMEATYLSFLEKRDQEAYTLLRARQDLGIANANFALQDLRVTEAKHGKDLADLQWQRAQAAWNYFNDLLTNPSYIDSIEDAALFLQVGAAAIQLYLSGVGLLAGFAAGGAFGAPSGPAAALAAASGGAAGMIMGAVATGGQGLTTLSGALSMYVGFERRRQDWDYQRTLAEFDTQIAVVQKTLADDHYNIAVQEKKISQINAENASDVVNFLNTKFTSVELYAWMGNIVSGIYRYLLQEATTVAKLAQRQLAFERQETELAVVLDDYWTYTDTSAILRGSSGSVDRRGMTGSARLLQDITRLDQEAFLTDQRKQQLSKTFSLALLDPIAFARFQESGMLPFATTLEQFDRNFPGHYLRLIKRVRVSVIALVPPLEGIRATLSSSGISRVVRGGSTFTVTEIRRDPESIAFTSSINATGQFELQEQPEMLFPFEGNGVAGSWVFNMPRPANVVDYSTIADVLVTIEYTALESTIYRDQIIQQLDRTFSGERPFSFRQQFADAWYDLHHPEFVRDPQKPMVVSFETRREDFPSNISELKIEQVTLYLKREAGAVSEINVRHLLFTEKGHAGSVGGTANTKDGLISTRNSNSGSWLGMIGKSPIGSWELAFTDDDDLRKLFANEEAEGAITDILFVITYAGMTPPWPALP